jgi:hypothetical protein
MHFSQTRVFRKNKNAAGIWDTGGICLGFQVGGYQ